MWGEPTRTPPDLARQLAEVRVAARAVIDAAKTFLQHGTTGNREHLAEAVAAYDASLIDCHLVRRRGGGW